MITRVVNLTDLDIWKCRFEEISKNDDEGVVSALRRGGEMKKFPKDALSKCKEILVSLYGSFGE